MKKNRYIFLFLAIALHGAALGDPCRILTLFDPSNSIDRVFPHLVREAFTHPDAVLFATALEVAHRMEPANPISRGKIAIDFINGNGGLFARDSVPINRDGRPQHKGQPFLELTSAVFPGQDPLRRTIDFVNGKYTDGIWQVPDGSQVLVILLPGAGGSYSHAGSTFDIASVLSKVNGIAKADPAAKKFHQELRRRIGDNHVIAAVTSMEMPATMMGPDIAAFSKKGSLVEWLTENIRVRRAAAGNIPTVVIARSAYAGILPQIAKEAPGLIDGMVLAGVTHPLPDLGLNESYFAAVTEHRNEVAGALIDNEASYKLVNRALVETNWSFMAEPFSGVPTQVLVGKLDAQVSKAARDYFRSATPDFHEIEGAQHNPYINQAGTKEIALYSYGLTYAFLKRVVSFAAGRP